MNPREALAPLEAALVDHHAGRTRGPLRLRFDDGQVVLVDPGWFFREPEAFDAVDRAALARVPPGARVLDVGAGAGAHALPLQDRGCPVTALEVLPGAAGILRERGVADVRRESVWEHVPDAPYDAVLLLMNGTGLAGTLARLGPLLARVRELLAPGGRALIDSTDPGPDDDDPGDDPGAGPGDPHRGDAGPGDPHPGPEAPGDDPGEHQIQLEYDGRRGAPFPHLYVDPATLAEHARAAGLSMEVVELDAGGGAPEEGRFLAELRRR